MFFVAKEFRMEIRGDVVGRSTGLGACSMGAEVCATGAGACATGGSGESFDRLGLVKVLLASDGLGRLTGVRLGRIGDGVAGSDSASDTGSVFDSEGISDSSSIDDSCSGAELNGLGVGSVGRILNRGEVDFKTSKGLLGTGSLASAFL